MYESFFTWALFAFMFLFFPVLMYCFFNDYRLYNLRWPLKYSLLVSSAGMVLCIFCLLSDYVEKNTHEKIFPIVCGNEVLETD
jgi:hypothetical protein